MSIDKNIYLGPFLLVKRKNLKKLNEDGNCVYDFTDGAMHEATCESGKISKVFAIVLPNRGLGIDRDTDLMEESTCYEEMAGVDIDREKIVFADYYSTHISKIREAVGEGNAYIAWGYIVYWS